MPVWLQLVVTAGILATCGVTLAFYMRSMPEKVARQWVDLATAFDSLQKSWEARELQYSQLHQAVLDSFDTAEAKRKSAASREASLKRTQANGEGDPDSKEHLRARARAAGFPV